jgi:single-strand DNA-binding protein
MARSVNFAVLIGNLTKAPEVRYTGAGVAVATFTVATNKEWTGADGIKSEAVQYHNIVAWRKLAEICGEYLKKGSKVYVKGEIGYRSYDKDGIKKYITEITIDEMTMLDGKKSDEHAEPVAAGAPESKDGDLPF